MKLYDIPFPSLLPPGTHVVYAFKPGNCKSNCFFSFFFWSHPIFPIGLTICLTTYLRVNIHSHKQ